MCVMLPLQGQNSIPVHGPLYCQHPVACGSVPPDDVWGQGAAHLPPVWL